jgi:RES domain-containing protein
MPEQQALTLWRAFVPRWAHLPLSGEGAARFGGRWNPVGQPAIYAARELSTAWAEYNQGFVQHPALIAQLELSGADLADLTDDSVLEELGVGEDIHHCQWRDAMDRGVVPQTHELAARLLAQGRHGVVYPSVMSPGGTCVALWRWNDATAPRLTVTDPEHRLPMTPASWL